MQIDAYGFDATSQWFCRRELSPYRVKTIGDNTYVCFHEGDPRPIHRLQNTNGEIISTWAYGAWEDAENLDYIPINETREV